MQGSTVHRSSSMMETRRGRHSRGATPQLVCAVAVVLAGAEVGADDWPEFRGATGQGHSSERGLVVEWSESQNIVWKVPVPGLGWSSPAISDGRVWLTTAIDLDEGEGSLRAVAFDARSGRQVVNVEVFRIPDVRAPNPKNSLASPTPVVEGDRVYVHFGAYGTAALTTNGEVVWTMRFPYDSQHGNGGSPIVHGDLLIFSCDGYDTAFVVALDKETGEIRWRTDRRRPFSQAYSTPLVIRVGEQDQIVSVGAFRTTAYHPRTGAELWQVAYGDGFSNVPRPVYGHGLVYIATGFQVPSLLAVRSDGSGDVTRSHVAWTLGRAAPLTPSPLLVGDELYIVSDLGIASCVDARTGTVYWQERFRGNFSASPVYADGRIYFQSEEGVTTVIAPGQAYQPLATNRLDGFTLASMAVSDGSIFIRSDSHLYRVGGA
jgi:outer membrane protein assembly factor BamB